MAVSPVACSCKREPENPYGMGMGRMAVSRMMAFLMLILDPCDCDPLGTIGGNGDGNQYVGDGGCGDGSGGSDDDAADWACGVNRRRVAVAWTSKNNMGVRLRV